VVDVGANIFYRTANPIPVKSLRIRIENEESRVIQIQGISPAILLKPGECHELSVIVGQDINGAYICAFNTSDGSIRVKFDVLNKNLDGAIIKFRGLAGDGP